MQRPIEVATPVPVAFARARDVLLDDLGAVFGEAFTVDGQNRSRIPAELSVDLGAGASLHQDVRVQLGVAQSTVTGVIVPVAWHASGRERLFPTFKGELAAFEAHTGTLLRLDGTYSVPFGVIGRIGNGVVGWRLARRSLVALLERLAGRLEAEAERRRQAAVRRPPRNPVAPPDWERSEMFIG
jgi:hypothetical protein